MFAEYASCQGESGLMIDTFPDIMESTGNMIQVSTNKYKLEIVIRATKERCMFIGTCKEGKGMDFREVIMSIDIGRLRRH